MKPRAPLQAEAVPKKIREGNDAGHRRDVGMLPCIICGRPSGPAHHLLIKEERGGSMRATDQWCLPLCPPHHTGSPHAVHENAPKKMTEEEFFARYGIDARAAARTLWRHRGDLDGMRNAIIKIRMAAQLVVMKREKLGL